MDTGLRGEGMPPAPRGRGTVPARAGSRGILGSEAGGVKFRGQREIAATVALPPATRAESPFRRDAPPAPRTSELRVRAAVRTERVFVRDRAMATRADATTLLRGVDHALQLLDRRVAAQRAREAVLADRDHPGLDAGGADHRLGGPRRAEAPEGFLHLEDLEDAGAPAIARAVAEVAADGPEEDQVARLATREAEHAERLARGNVRVLAFRTEGADEPHRDDRDETGRNHVGSEA